jgi:hypothetical protein
MAANHISRGGGDLLDGKMAELDRRKEKADLHEDVECFGEQSFRADAWNSKHLGDRHDVHDAVGAGEATHGPIAHALGAVFPRILELGAESFFVRGPDQDAPDILMRLFEAILPLARRALLQNASYSMVRILHENDYVMEKAFVWGVIAFSKWLGRDQFKNGIHDWPPALPANLASMTMVEPVIIKDDVPPHLRASLGSGSAG